MKPTYTRRIRRKAASSKDGGFFKKEAKENSFFGESHEPSFFQPAQNVVQLKCDDCEKDEKKKTGEDMKAAVDSKVKGPEEKKKEDDDKKLMKKEIQGGSLATSTNASVIPNGSGSILPAQTQQFFSNKLGYDFSGVKIHNDSNAGTMAKSLHAKAYTIGNNIVFNNGEYSTSSHDGKKLLAHELVHVMQQGQGGANRLNRKPQNESLPGEKEEVIIIPTFTQGPERFENTTHYANCAGVSVQGHTSANYSHSFSAPGSSTPTEDCEGCTGTECVTNSGVVISTFRTNPVVSLPGVPGGLNKCEQTAVRNFINTTLRAHEQQHVAAFNQYMGVVRTPYSYRGCASGLEAHQDRIHTALEQSRRSSADTASAALDPFNPPIPCDCPDPQPETQPETE